MKYSTHFNSTAFLVACVGIATFATMDVVMKGLSLQLGAYNALFWRSIISASLAGLIFLWHRPAWPGQKVIRLHIWRGLIISIMAFLFFWGLKYLPIAEAIGLSFIAPLIALYLAAVILHEHISGKSIAASLIGLLGAMIVIGGRLGGEYDEETGKGIAAILLSAVMYAYNLILQRQQALVARPVEIAFFQNCTIIVLFSCLAPFFAVAPSITVVPNLAAAAILGLVSMMMMSWAYARAPASTLLPVEYTAFAWAALLGWLVFSETVTLTAVFGTALIVVGCLIAAWREPQHADHVETTAV
ncbi:MAG: DMT family transporter [Gammaproteobacteria bacterium]|nr:DMT family transporter [Gammaproteobacteria bacterium]